MNFRTVVAAVLLLAGIAAEASGQSTAIALRAGTLGPSLGTTTSLHPKLNLRADAAYLSYQHSAVMQEDDFELEMEGGIRLLSVSALVDAHPFKNAFRLTAGLVLNKNEASFAGRSGGPQTVGDQTYSAEEIGELSGVVRFGGSVVPYLGLGLGNPVSPGKRLGLALDLGVMFSGPPTVSMVGTGMVAPTAEETGTIQQNLDWAKYYPSLSIALTYKIF